MEIGPVNYANEGEWIAQVIQRPRAAVRFLHWLRNNVNLGVQRHVPLYIRDAYARAGLPSKKRKFAQVSQGPPMKSFKSHGGAGYTGQSFRKGYIRKQKVGSNGAVLKTEVGQLKTDANCVFVGHGLAVTTAMRTVLTAIIRKLYKKAGYDYDTEFETTEFKPAGGAPSNNFIVQFYYRRHAQEQYSFLNITASNQSTLAGIVSSVLAQIAAITVSNTDENKIEIPMMQLYNEDAQLLATLRTEDVIVTLNFTSTINIQNQTLGAGASDDLEGDVTNNPVQGKIYTGTGNGSSLKFSNGQSTDVTDSGLAPYAFSRSGYIWYDRAGLLEPQNELLNRPPPAAVFTKQVSQQKIVLNPGEVKRFTIQRSLTKSFTQILQDFYPVVKSAEAVSSDVAKFPVSWGSFQVFALDKMCRTGSGSSLISIGIEVNGTYSATLSTRKRKWAAATTKF